jgi:hypothetical protein
VARSRQGTGGTVSRLLSIGGQAHPRDVLLAMATLGLGIVAAVCGLFDSLHIPGSWAGAAGLLTGTVSQMLSSTLAERWINVIGWVLSFVGLLLSMANGGFL